MWREGRRKDFDMKPIVKRTPIRITGIKALDTDVTPLAEPLMINPGEVVLLEVVDGEFVVKSRGTEYPKFRRQKRKK